MSFTSMNSSTAASTTRVPSRRTRPRRSGGSSSPDSSPWISAQTSAATRCASQSSSVNAGACSPSSPCCGHARSFGRTCLSTGSATSPWLRGHCRTWRGRTRCTSRTSWSVDGSGLSHESPDSKATENVEFVRLDDFLAEAGVGRVNFIKLDVDGFEFKVLLGARKTLEAHRPVMLINFR